MIHYADHKAFETAVMNLTEGWDDEDPRWGLLRTIANYSMCWGAEAGPRMVQEEILAHRHRP